MATSSETSEVNIHLRARASDRDLIDRAASVAGTNRSQFMLASALREATNVLLDQTMIRVEAEAFQRVLAWMESPPSDIEAQGMVRLKAAQGNWSDG